MRDVWYADNRDLIKWGSFLLMARDFAADRIVQLTYLRPSEFGRLVIDGEEHDIPPEVINHFRNVRMIGSLGSKIRISVFDPTFLQRDKYQAAALALLKAFRQERCIVFLDPDTGLAPLTPSLDHVLASEARAVWDALKVGDVFALYQHQTNRAGQPWIEPKQEQLATALGFAAPSIKVASGAKIAQDVVIFYVQKV